MNFALLYRTMRTSTSAVTTSFPIGHNQKQDDKSIHERNRSHMATGDPPNRETARQSLPRQSARESFVVLLVPTVNASRARPAIPPQPHGIPPRYWRSGHASDLQLESRQLQVT